jgi:hypothetical protein
MEISKKYVRTCSHFLGVMKHVPSNLQVTVQYCSILQLNVEHNRNN